MDANLVKIDENLVKNVKKTAELRLIFTQLLDLDNCLEKQQLKKSFLFHILRWTGFLMVPLTTLYDYYIDRPKLTEQKKPI